MSPQLIRHILRSACVKARVRPEFIGDVIRLVEKRAHIGTDGVVRIGLMRPDEYIRKCYSTQFYGDRSLIARDGEQVTYDE
jgi:hypothetical protein